MDVKYFGNGGMAIVVGDGDARQVDDGRGNVTEVATKRVIVVDPASVEEVEADQLADERPALHPDTGRPLSETENRDAVGRGGPSLDELEAEIARLRAENAAYSAVQDRSGSTQVAAEQQPAAERVGAETTTAPTITEAPATQVQQDAPFATPEGYTDNGDGTYTRQADGVRGTIDWDAKTFHPQA